MKLVADDGRAGVRQDIRGGSIFHVPAGIAAARGRFDQDLVSRGAQLLGESRNWRL